MKRASIAEMSAFVAIAERASFAKAATQLGVSRSSLSESLRALEERLGVRLLNRTTRSVALTEAGERLLSQLRPLLDNLDSALESVNAFRDSPAGHVRITVPRPAVRTVIEPILSREGVALEVLANDVQWQSDGWRATFRNGDACGTCGEPCKRADLPANGEIVYVGDGYSDRCAAQAADRIFARDGLARYLAERGVAYEPFEDLHDVARSLA